MTDFEKLQLQAMKEDPGLLAAWSRARKTDPDIGWMDVQEQREKEQDLDKPKPQD